MAGMPLGRIEVEFTAGTWTDVSAYQLPGAITMTCGRADTGERVSPGRLTGLRLNNTDGRFTVGNTSSPYYPNVTSGKQIRVSVRDPVGGVTWYPRFTGRIDGWPLSWENNGETCVVSLTAVDALNDWAVADMPTDYMYRAAAALTPPPVSYWACTSVTAAGTMPAAAGGGDLVNSGTAPTALSVDTFPGDNGKAFPFTYSTSGSSGYYSGGVAAITSNTWGFSAWVKITDDPISTGAYAVIVEANAAAPPGYRVAFRVKPDGAYLSTISSGGVVADRVGPLGGGTITDGSWHHLVARFTESAGVVTATFAVDGVGGSLGGLTPLQTIADQSARSLRIGTTMTGSVCHVAVWSGSDSASLLQRARPAAGLYGGAVRADTRLEQIASLAGLDGTSLTGFTTRATVAASTPFGKALDLARQAEATDGGLLYCHTTGGVYYARLGVSVATLALTLDSGDVSSLQVAADRATLANEVTVTSTAPLSGYRPDLTSTTVVVADPVSIAAVGRRPRSLDVIWTDDGDPGYLYTLGGELMQTTEAPRIPSLAVDALTLSAADQLAVLGARVWNQIALTGLPSAGGMPAAWLGRIEGWTEVIDSSAWQVTYSTSFAGNRIEDATHGLILGSNRLG